ncbi:MAG: hypothetical protein LBU14_00730 [Candidatus Peribacteria bacterium]|nr:hypothetical protein [Candidatus Peribacteria bacterium]
MIKIKSHKEDRYSLTASCKLSQIQNIQGVLSFIILYCQVSVSNSIFTQLDIFSNKSIIKNNF